MCSKDVNSILQQTSIHGLETFEWSILINELEMYAPTLMSILKGCTRTQHQRHNREGVIGICAAVLLKYRNYRMNLVQKMISTILHAGHSGKLVSTISAHHLISNIACVLM